MKIILRRLSALIIFPVLFVVIGTMVIPFIYFVITGRDFVVPSIDWAEKFVTTNQNN